AHAAASSAPHPPERDLAGRSPAAIRERTARDPTDANAPVPGGSLPRAGPHPPPKRRDHPTSRDTGDDFPWSTSYQQPPEPIKCLRGQRPSRRQLAERLSLACCTSTALGEKR